MRSTHRLKAWGIPALYTAAALVAGLTLPRIVPMIARDELIPHALGVFAATFLYALAAMAGLDRHASSQVPVLSLCVVIGLLIATMAMLIGLVQRIGLLQMSHVLRLMGGEGREAIART